MRRAAIAISATVLVWLSVAAPALAQPRRSGPPRGALQVRFGWFMPSGSSDFWDATEDVFTLDTSDLDGFVLGFSYVRSINNELEVGLNVDFYDERARSQYRDWVDENGFPIFHDTKLGLIPWTVDVRFIPGGRYRLRPGGRFIRKPLFYIGGGVGFVWWEYEEVGDFLDFDFDPPEIFGSRFSDDGVTFEAHALAGVEVPVGQSINLMFEGRYSVAEDDLRGDFAGLAETDLDLGGLAIYAGFNFRF